MVKAEIFLSGLCGIKVVRSVAVPARWSRPRPKVLLLSHLNRDPKTRKTIEYPQPKTTVESQSCQRPISHKSNPANMAGVMLISHDKREIPKRFSLIGCRFIRLKTISDLQPSILSISPDYLLLSSFTAKLASLQCHCCGCVIYEPIHRTVPDSTAREYRSRMGTRAVSFH